MFRFALIGISLISVENDVEIDFRFVWYVGRVEVGLVFFFEVNFSWLVWSSFNIVFLRVELMFGWEDFIVFVICRIIVIFK